MRRKLAAGNWKMNGLAENLGELEQIARQSTTETEVLICPPNTLISRAADIAGSVKIGGQDCHANVSGAHTGDTSAEMLRDAGASYVILGHSERRADHAEPDSLIAAKTQAAWRAGLVAIVCLGESLEQREAGTTLAVIKAQLDASLPEGATAENTVIAYEPIWAIGTGKIPTLAQIGEVHGFLRADLSQGLGDAGQNISLLYGGSVKPSNAAEIFAIQNVDGALVGGASLKSNDFNAIISALDAS